MVSRLPASTWMASSRRPPSASSKTSCRGDIDLFLDGYDEDSGNARDFLGGIDWLQSGWITPDGFLILPNWNRPNLASHLPVRVTRRLGADCQQHYQVRGADGISSDAGKPHVNRVAPTNSHLRKGRRHEPEERRLPVQGLLPGGAGTMYLSHGGYWPGTYARTNEHHAEKTADNHRKDRGDYRLYSPQEHWH